MPYSLSQADMDTAAQSIQLDPSALAALCAVESRGSGFVAPGKPTILFEGHIFWRQLQKAGVAPAPYAERLAHIVYPRWTKQFYLKPSIREYERLEAAIAVHETAALASASWGMFQIMGFNHALCGFGTVQQFVAAQKTSAANQLASVLVFLEKTDLIGHLRNKNWRAFAKGYNGPGYAKNKYDQALERAFERHKASLDTNTKTG